MENKQTAVEWMLDQMFNKNKLKYEQGVQYVMPEFVQQAKQMEKEQMEAAWCNGYDNGWDKKEMDFQEYYDKIL